jgi:FixJ family two-component response regulator
MTPSDFTVFLVDDDAGVLKAMSRLVGALGYAVRAFSSPQQFLDAHDPAIAGCAVLDVAMPELDGLELQQALTLGGCERPIIFVTGRGDIPTSVRAMKAGAVDFLTKPVKESELMAALGRAVEREQGVRQARAELLSVRQRLASLTPRELEVLTHVIAGRLNKQIAGDLGTVEKTVKVHRGRVMEKLAVRSVADLVRLADRAGVRPHGARS